MSLATPLNVVVVDLEVQEKSNERQNNCAYSFDCYFVSIVFSNNNDASSNTAS